MVQFQPYQGGLGVNCAGKSDDFGPHALNHIGTVVVL